MQEILTVSGNDEYCLFTSVKSWIDQLIADIEKAEHYIYIETFRLNDDPAGRQVCEALIKQAEKGIEIKLVLDSWGTRKTPIFQVMEKHGIKIRFFKKLIFNPFGIFKNNHERNHRKIIAIDDRISYIGSANFSKYSFKWRESILRINRQDLAKIFKRIFLENFKIYKKKIKPTKYYKTITFQDFKIIRETPSIIHQKTRDYFIKLIDNAKETIDIITPYFLTGKTFRDKLVNAVKRGVRVRVIIPWDSDVRSVDCLRDLFLGKLHRKGIQFQMYRTGNLHAKLMLIDQNIFSIGSTNFDYRSFRYMHEINLSGTNAEISKLVEQYIAETVKECMYFNYTLWLFRPLHEKIIGWLLYPVRRLI